MVKLQRFFIFTPIFLGKWSNLYPIWQAYFSNGVVQPPTCSLLEGRMGFWCDFLGSFFGYGGWVGRKWQNTHDFLAYSSWLCQSIPACKAHLIRQDSWTFLSCLGPIGWSVEVEDPKSTRVIFCIVLIHITSYDMCGVSNISVRNWPVFWVQPACLCMYIYL